MKCIICGHSQKVYQVLPMTSLELAKAWQLSPREIAGFNRRESKKCRFCGASHRSRVLAEALVKSYQKSGARDLASWVKFAIKQDLQIAEINYFGDLHPWLQKIPGLILSQYSESTWRAKIANWLKGIKSQDLTNLSYPSASFDLVLHTEVLEHLQDVERAIAECRRILKPSGFALFTVPLIPNRQTQPADPNIPSYHGAMQENNLVYWEFGGDFIKRYNLEVVVSYPQDYLYVLRLNPN